MGLNSSPVGNVFGLKKAVLIEIIAIDRYPFGRYVLWIRCYIAGGYNNESRGCIESGGYTDRQGAGMWPMFAFGFGAIFILTQLYGLGLKAWQRWIFIGIYVISALYVYNGRLVEGFLEIIRIPAIDYILVFVLAGIFWLGSGRNHGDEKSMR